MQRAYCLVAMQSSLKCRGRSWVVIHVRFIRSLCFGCILSPESLSTGKGSLKSLGLLLSLLTSGVCSQSPSLKSLVDREKALSQPFCDAGAPIAVAIEEIGPWVVSVLLQLEDVAIKEVHRSWLIHVFKFEFDINFWLLAGKCIYRQIYRRCSHTTRPCGACSGLPQLGKCMGNVFASRICA